MQLWGKRRNYKNVVTLTSPIRREYYFELIVFGKIFNKITGVKFLSVVIYAMHTGNIFK